MFVHMQYVPKSHAQAQMFVCGQVDLDQPVHLYRNFSVFAVHLLTDLLMSY